MPSRVDECILYQDGVGRLCSLCQLYSKLLPLPGSGLAFFKASDHRGILLPLSSGCFSSCNPVLQVEGRPLPLRARSPVCLSHLVNISALSPWERVTSCIFSSSHEATVHMIWHTKARLPTGTGVCVGGREGTLRGCRCTSHLCVCMNASRRPPFLLINPGTFFSHRLPGCLIDSGDKMPVIRTWRIFKLQRESYPGYS